MFRCPNCGQGKQITIKDIHDETMEITLVDEMTEVESFNGNRGLSEEIKTEVVERVNNAPTTQECECHKCNEVHTFEQWTEARYDSLKYLEMDHEQLCHCGGELWMDLIPGTRTYGFVCEDCNWVKPKKTVSGA